ncbi:putative transport protein (Permease) [Bosea sp. LC85]|uniref:MFS transporter n=1 Tax=Bosea sp. LC85 TaxID=1502851 RepID=UPI0004E3EB9D|nr:MFS transporter [Bosea sp. LC85]KFC63290.1 putative transport protein (Permease) [Bosea sp. LC85]
MNARITIEAGKAPGRAELAATRIAFFVAGLGIAAWAPLVPYAKARTSLDDGALGLLLLCLGAGSILAMPLSGALASRFGCRRVLIGASLLVALMLPALATAAQLPLLGLALFIFGAGIGSLDCVINIQAVIVERASGRSMMSGFHGLFSVGGIAGAAGVSGLLMLGATPLFATLIVVAILLAAMAWAASGLLPYAGKGEGPAFAIPHGAVLFIGVLCFVVFLAEGAMLDWSAVFLTDLRQVDAAYAGLGYAAFASTMTIGRLIGDRFVQRLGPQRIIISGGLCAAAGLVLATLAPSWLAGLAGYALVGAGCSNIVPVLYTAVGRQKSMPEHIAVPAISTLGYAGILVGPAAIGAVAHLASLPIAFLIVAALLIGVAASAPRLRI